MGILKKGLAGAVGVLLSVVIAVAAPAQPRHTHSNIKAGTTLPLPTGTTTTTTGPPPPATITVKASSTHIFSSHQVIISGRTTGVPPGTQVDLIRHRYPYHTGKLVRTAKTQSDGSFTFAAVFPDRDTVYQAEVPGTATQASVLIHVLGAVRARITAFPVSEVRVHLVIYHPSDLRWNGVKVKWSFAKGYHGRWFSGPKDRTRRVSPYATELEATVVLPPGHYRWRACFHAPDDHALDDPRTPPGCTGRGYRGNGSAPFGFPSLKAIQRAEAYLNSRGGHTALAVVTSEGRQYGVRIHDQFITGSVVKAMLLVAYLRRLHDQGQHTVDSYSNSFLYPMIHYSDNNAATQCWSIVGNSGLYAVAHVAHMTDFSIDTSASWGSEWGAALLSTADQSKFFFEMPKIIPHEFVGYADYLLSTIVDYESWGIPAIARPQGWTVYFKGGWRPSPDVYLVHQIARLHRHKVTFSMAVMTDGDPDMGYGIDSIQGTTSALLQ